MITLSRTSTIFNSRNRTTDQGLEDTGLGDDPGEPGEESDVGDFLWDGLLIEDEDESSMDYSD